MKWKLAANPIFFFLRTLLPDQRFVLVVRIVGVSELSIRIELKLEELVAELALVAHIVAHIEISILRHCYVIDGVRTIKTAPLKKKKIFFLRCPVISGGDSNKTQTANMSVQRPQGGVLEN